MTRYEADPVPVFSAVTEATPERLAPLLHRADVLQVGERIEAVHVAATDAFNSRAYQLEVQRQGNGPPIQLFLKLNDADRGAWEVAFYRYLMRHRPSELPIPACYDARFDPATGRSHLLLEGVQAGHAAPVSRAQLLAGQGVPTPRNLAQIVTALARFHAAWWQHPRLASDDGFFALRSWYRERGSDLIVARDIAHARIRDGAGRGIRPPWAHEGS